MATRATYQINATNFYCHWDGYPTGAAGRFAKMIAARTVADPNSYNDGIEDRRGGFEYAFIRGVMDAEPTKSRNAHGDTEHHYEVEVDKDGRARITHFVPDWDSRRWHARTTCELHLWINTQRATLLAEYAAWAKAMNKVLTDEEIAEQMDKDIPLIVRAIIPASYHGGPDRYFYATATEAEKIAQANADRAASFDDSNPNKQHYQQRADAWRKAIEEVTAKPETEAA